jgi:hypothetical protein
MKVPITVTTTDNQQADNMIECGRPWKDLFLLFSSKRATYEYFAVNRSRRFKAPDTYCAACGQHCDTPPIKFIWRANLHTRKTILLSFVFTMIAVWAYSVYSRWVVVQFVTFHRLCLNCQRQHRNRRIISVVLNKILFSALILFVFLTVPATVFFIASIFVIPEARILFAVGALIGIGLLGLVAWGFEMCRRAIIPQTLRQIGRFPFFLYELQKAS